MGVLRLVIGIMGNGASIALLSAPIITFTRVIRKRSTEEFSCIPYTLALLSCFAYGWYSSPVVSYGWENIALFTIDGIGILLESSFIIIYLWFAPRREKVKVASMTVLMMMMFILVVLVSIFAFDDHHHRRVFVGLFGAMTNVVMSGSPLVAMKIVIETKSVEFMPFYLSFFTFLSCVLWATYGLLDLDFFIATPTSISSLLGLIQLLLYFKYKKSGGIKEEPENRDAEKNEEKTKVEMPPEVKNSPDQVVY